MRISSVLAFPPGYILYLGWHFWPKPEDGCWLLNIDFITFCRILFGQYFF